MWSSIMESRGYLGIMSERLMAGLSLLTTLAQAKIVVNWSPEMMLWPKLRER